MTTPLRKRRLSARATALRVALPSRDEVCGVLSNMTENGYTIGKALRGGSGGASLREVNQGNKSLVLKLAPCGEGVMRLAAEYKILRSLNHPNIVEAYDWHTSAQDQGFTMMFCSGDKLDRALNHLCLRQSYCVAQRIVGVVQYLHAKDIVHQDLHAGNVIASPSHDGDTSLMQVSVIDFGSAKSVPDAKVNISHICREQSGDAVSQGSARAVSQSSAFAGEVTSPAILPPAIPSVSMGSATKRDVFAVGLLLASLVRRSHTVTEDLFTGPQIVDAWWSPQPANKEVCSYIEKLLDLNAARRISSEQALELLPILEVWLGDYCEQRPRSQTRISL
eukprot:TRINITY_DN90735_c0_g1_i1.p1 TRINITY_DN90735_c0_g1~~TRINITY_DN90735_c0_g1_i1.p1  ORF type:complete len:364 (-),score=40.98 TRINITY_DN90735_c0_g1_i1:142-1146(-)